METPDPSGTVRTSRWGRHTAGTYYVEAPEKRRCHWLVYCILFLCALIFAIIFAVGVYLATYQETKETWFMREFYAQCGESGNWSDHNVTAYRKYFLSFEGKNISELCTSFHCYLGNQAKIKSYNTDIDKNSTFFGNTVFSDWCEPKRLSYLRNKLIVYLGKGNVGTHNTTRYSRNNGIPRKIMFDDSLPINETVKIALLQWFYYSDENNASRTMFSDWQSFVENASNEYDLYEFKNLDKIQAEDEYQKSYLFNKGIFATEVYLTDAVFFYQDGILPSKVCSDYRSKVKFPVIVLGFDVDSSGTQQYWEVQPVGEQFKFWGRNGTMLIHDTCYKRHFIPRVIDIDMKSRRETVNPDDGIPLGKLSTLPIVS